MRQGAMSEAKATVVEVEIPREETYEVGSARWYRFVGSLVDLVPWHRNTQAGRNKAKTAKFVLMAVGLGFAAFAGPESMPLLVVGVLLALMALLVPVSELKRRTWKVELKKKGGSRTRTVWEGGELRLEGDRVELRRGDEKVRHVRLDKEGQETVVARIEDRACLGVLPRGKRKKESIWLIASGAVDAIDLDEVEELDKGRVDQPARLAPSEFLKVYRELRG